VSLLNLLDDAGRVVRNWGPNIVPATAAETARYGPQAARVNALFEGLGRLSDDAGALTRDAGLVDARNDVWRAASGAMYRAARRDAAKYASGAAQDNAYNLATNAAHGAAIGEVLSDLITPNQYLTLTRPLATGRLFDILRPNAPETFTPVARQLGEMGAITSPRGIRLARDISLESPEFSQLVLSLMGNGMSVQDAMLAAKALL